MTQAMFGFKQTIRTWSRVPLSANLVPSPGPKKRVRAGVLPGVLGPLPANGKAGSADYIQFRVILCLLSSLCIEPFFENSLPPASLGPSHPSSPRPSLSVYLSIALALALALSLSLSVSLALALALAGSLSLSLSLSRFVSLSLSLSLDSILSLCLSVSSTFTCVSIMFVLICTHL